MKVYCGVEIWLFTFLTSATHGGEWSASRPGRFTPRERAPGMINLFRATNEFSRSETPDTYALNIRIV